MHNTTEPSPFGATYIHAISIVAAGPGESRLFLVILGRSNDNYEKEGVEASTATLPQMHCVAVPGKKMIPY